MCKYRSFILQVLEHDLLDVKVTSEVTLESSWQNQAFISLREGNETLRMLLCCNSQSLIWLFKQSKDSDSMMATAKLSGLDCLACALVSQWPVDEIRLQYLWKEGDNPIATQF